MYNIMVLHTIIVFNYTMHQLYCEQLCYASLIQNPSNADVYLYAVTPIPLGELRLVYIQ